MHLHVDFPLMLVGSRPSLHADIRWHFYFIINRDINSKVPDSRSSNMICMYVDQAPLIQIYVASSDQDQTSRHGMSVAHNHVHVFIFAPSGVLVSLSCPALTLCGYHCARGPLRRK